MYIFWDNSNIHFSGVHYACPKFEPEVDTVLYRTYFKNLFALVKNNRPIDKAFVAGSVPPEEDDLWEYIRSLGVELTLLDRTADGKEQESVDILLQNEMLRLMIDLEKNPDTIAIITGDGAGYLNGRGFLADIERAQERGWNIEVYSWDGTCNKNLKNFAQEKGKYISLDDYYFSISFIKKDYYGTYKGRKVSPLII